MRACTSAAVFACFLTAFAVGCGDGEGADTPAGIGGSGGSAGGVSGAGGAGGTSGTGGVSGTGGSGGGSAGGVSGAGGAGGTSGTGGVSGMGGGGGSTGGSGGTGGGGGSGGAEEGRAFQTGWWVRVHRSDLLAQLAAEGNTLVLADSGIWFAKPGERETIRAFLDEAQQYGIKVLLQMAVGESGISGITSTEEYVITIQTFRDHPALAGWYIADEPNLFDYDIIHRYLDEDPGFYHLIQANDPNHPAFISFNQPYADDHWVPGWETIRSWYDVTDLVAIHAYSSYAGTPEFWAAESRYFYDLWKQMVDDARTYDKQGVIATCQGFGDNSGFSDFRTPTYAEIRYEVFSAVVSGVDKVLFWLYDDIGERDPGSVQNVRQMVAQLQSIGVEMNAGITFDPAVATNVGADELAYRHGVHGGTHAILAVNIADRMSGGRAMNAQFTLPQSVDASQVEVLHEDRSIPVVGGVFTDSFDPFEVHIYRFSSEP